MGILMSSARFIRFFGPGPLRAFLEEVNDVDDPQSDRNAINATVESCMQTISVHAVQCTELSGSLVCWRRVSRVKAQRGEILKTNPPVLNCPGGPAFGPV